MSNCVYNRGTYNIYHLSRSDRALEIELKMYGQQIVAVRLQAEPSRITSSNPLLQVVDYHYDQNHGVAKIEIKGRNIQGERGKITLVL